MNGIIPHISLIHDTCHTYTELPYIIFFVEQTGMQVHRQYRLFAFVEPAYIVVNYW